MAVSPRYGGRIISFKYGESELIRNNSDDLLSVGSTFWTSPQAVWNWPPPANIDSSPYSFNRTGNSIILTSSIDGLTNIKVIKEISPHHYDDSFIIKYKIINCNKESVFTAPWEITRVNKGGEFFFSSDDENLNPKTFELSKTDKHGNIFRYKSSVKELLTKPQLSASRSSGGWSAYLYNDLIFIKIFESIKEGEAAPGEGAVLFYVSRDDDFLELENQGKFSKIQPGEELTYEVIWTVLEPEPNASFQKIVAAVEDHVSKF
ncbi:DUF4380 domain-containing protein [Melioribacter sp. Ez-97]|uniref:DUF4380 domain-containing protein n=1 Tax=Melioribacter sp. Ez-97 TaxID=3423434 RepID=UPI003ED95DBE